MMILDKVMDVEALIVIATNIDKVQIFKQIQGVPKKICPPSEL